MTCPECDFITEDNVDAVIHFLSRHPLTIHALEPLSEAVGSVMLGDSEKDIQEGTTNGITKMVAEIILLFK